MAKMEIALDLGTSFTSIFASGYGIVLHEPSVIAYSGDGKKRVIRAVGNEAYGMLGRSPEKMRIVCPVSEGVIADGDACTDMLAAFINKIMPDSYISRPKIRCIVGVPMGISIEDRELYEKTLMRAGVDEIIMIHSVILAAIGAGFNAASEFGGFICTIGGGATEIAAVGLSGIVTGCAVNVGGDMMDRALADRMCGLYKIITGRSTTRLVKEKICSLIGNDVATIGISGKDADTKNIRNQVVMSHELYGDVYVYYKAIIDAISDVIDGCRPEVIAEISKSGMVIAGGGAKIPGLTQLAERLLRIRVSVPRNCEYCTVIGGGSLWTNSDLREEILLHQ